MIHLKKIKKFQGFIFPIPKISVELGLHYDAILSPTSLELEIAPNKNGYEVDGSFHYHVVVPCSRCAVEMFIEGNTGFNISYYPKDNEVKQKNIIVAEENSEIVYFTDDLIKPADLVIQQLILELPVKPLCMENCKGLCQQCGAVLNTEECKCDRGVLNSFPAFHLSKSSKDQ